MVEAGSIWIRLGLDTSQLIAGVDRTKKSMLDWRTETLEDSREMLKWGAAIGATVAPVIAAGAAAYATVEKFGGMAQSIKDLSYTTGLSTQKIQELDYAATLSGTQFTTVTPAIENFTLAIAKAGDATSDAGKAFSELGVTTSGRTTDQVLEDTFIALTNMKDETERNTIANTLYGKSWKDMIPYMDAYITNAKEIKANHYLSDDELNANAEAKEQLDALGKRWEIAEARMLSYFTNYFKNADRAYIESALKNPTGAYEKRILEDAGYSIDPNGTYDAGGGIEKPFRSTIKSTSELTDKYLGMSDAQIALQDATDALTEAQADQATALSSKDSEAYDKASRLVAIYTNKVKELTAALNENSEASEKVSTNAANWGSNAVIGSAGSEMASFMKDELAHGADYQTALNAWSIGVHSYARVGGDFGTLGASNDPSAFLAAGGSQEQWDLIYGTTTRNPGKNEREATAAATTKSGSSGTSGTGDKTTTATSPSEQAASETSLQKTELDKQLANVKTYLTDTQKAYLAGYLAIEKTDREHWTFLTEEEKTSLGNLTDNYKTWVKYVADNPTIMNIGVVMWTKAGADWDPLHNAEFMQTVRMSAMISSTPEYSSVDLSKIAFAGSSDKKSGDTKIDVTQNFNGTTDPAAVKTATKDGVSEALAEDSAARGLY